MKRLKKGFTLIELLVVIAIIGILAAVVLVNVNQARQRARDTSIQTAISQVRSQMELSITGVDYPIFTNSSDFSTIRQSIIDNGGEPLGDTTTNNTYVAAATNKQTGTSAKSYCVDTSGISKTYTSIITINATATNCP